MQWSWSPRSGHLLDGRTPEPAISQGIDGSERSWPRHQIPEGTAARHIFPLIYGSINCILHQATQLPETSFISAVQSIYILQMAKRHGRLLGLGLFSRQLISAHLKWDQQRSRATTSLFGTAERNSALSLLSGMVNRIYPFSPNLILRALSFFFPSSSKSSMLSWAAEARNYP